MKDIFNSYGYNLSDNEIYLFNEFKKLLQFYNKRFNITAITDDDGIIKKHFLDSISGKDLFDKDCSVIEIGSGGGFPSVPIKILRQDLKFTLVESTGKKCSFLETVKKELGFNDFDIYNARAEDLSKKAEFRENFDYATARAVARLNTLSEYCMPFVKVGGKFIAYKTDDKIELDESKNAVNILGGKLKEVKKYQIEDGDKRCIYVFDKIKNTPTAYPRGNGKERTKPIL